MAIIAILMTTITISIIIFIPTANIAKAKTDIGSLRLAMTQYYLKYSKYPESGSTGLDELKVFIEDGKVPKDPWGNAYVYTVPGPEDNINYEIMSKGPNGNPGDEDDIVSWKLDQKPEEK
jgi:general secretion pathway protein G